MEELSIRKLVQCHIEYSICCSVNVLDHLHAWQKGGIKNVIRPSCFCFNGNSYLNSSTLVVISAVIELVINGFTESHSFEEALCWLLYILTYSSLRAALSSLLS